MSAVPSKSAEPSMDEILASIRRIIADDQVEPTSRRPEAEPDELDLADLDEEPRPSPTAVAPPKAAPSLNDALNDVSFRDVDPSPAARPNPASSPVDLPPAPAHPAVDADDASVRDHVESLVSRATTETVGHAFGALSHTVFSRNPRTIEDLVGDLLRPMLKEWLDANLGPLVERLVRVEIERITHGQR